MTDIVKCFSYDVNVNAFPEGIEFSTDLPSIFYFSAYNKGTPYRRYIGEGIAGPILLYIQKNADLDLKFPPGIEKLGYPREQVNPPSQEAAKNEE